MAMRVSIVTAAAEPSPKCRSHDVGVFPGGGYERLVMVLANWASAMGWKYSSRWLREALMVWLSRRTGVKRARV
jgi:hypothetical protein